MRFSRKAVTRATRSTRLTAWMRPTNSLVSVTGLLLHGGDADRRGGPPGPGWARAGPQQDRQRQE